jgi:putative nucleotidyltransferase with HDIG domain
MAGYTADGHSARVAHTSVAIARELGIPAAHMKEIEYAALLHDIGRVSLSEPGAAEAGDRARLAEIGGQIVRETRHFPRVAEMIEHQHEDAGRTDAPIGSRIIRVCSDFDDLTSAHDEHVALDRVRAGAGLYYDVDVVRALETVVARRALAA